MKDRDRATLFSLLARARQMRKELNNIRPFPGWENARYNSDVHITGLISQLEYAATTDFDALPTHGETEV